MIASLPTYSPQAQPPVEPAAPAHSSADLAVCQQQLRPLLDAMEVLQGRWVFPLLLALWAGKARFKVLQRSLPGISAKVLSQTLDKLEAHGLVLRQQWDTAPITVEYELTDYGRTLQDVIFPLRDWGVQHRQRMLQA